MRLIPRCSLCPLKCSMWCSNSSFLRFYIFVTRGNWWFRYCLKIPAKEQIPFGDLSSVKTLAPRKDFLDIAAIPLKTSYVLKHWSKTTIIGFYEKELVKFLCVLDVSWDACWNLLRMMGLKVGDRYQETNLIRPQHFTAFNGWLFNVSQVSCNWPMH